MGRKLFRAVLAFVLIASMGVTSYAETYYGDPGWQVVFTKEKRMESNFKAKNIDDVIYGMQPGDYAVITLDLENNHSETTNWYMTNEVLDSLEDSAKIASGGAYTYILTYIKPDGEEKVLFSSDTVGGSTVSAAGEGLHEATNAMEGYFFLDTLTSGQRASVTLEVGLDGETQGNDYQDTLADLQMNFAVELGETSPDSGKPSKVIKTGDDQDLIPYFIASGVSGLLLLMFGCCGIRRRRKEQREVQD